MISFMNGIWTSFEGASENSRYLSSLAGGVNLHSVYNANVGFLEDLTKVHIGLKYPSMTQAVREAHRVWDRFFEMANPYERFLLICHSGGATQARLALESYSPELRKRIDVIAISPATYIPKDICHTVTHYVSKYDLVTHVDSRGRIACADTIVELEPHPSVPGWVKVTHLNHTLQDPTFRQPLIERINDYIEEAQKW